MSREELEKMIKAMVQSLPAQDETRLEQLVKAIIELTLGWGKENNEPPR